MHDSDRTVTLYTPEETAAVRARAKRLKTFLWILALTGLAACVVLCCLVNTANESTIRIAVTAVSAVFGWAVILVWALGYAPAKAVCAHMEGILGGEREDYTGALSLEEGVWHIPKSIWIRKVNLTDAEGNVQRLSVLAEKAGALPPEGAVIRAETVRKYILSAEVLHE